MDQSSIESRLLSGERLIWAGVPGQGLRLSPQDVFLVPFSVAWCGFAIFWEISVMKDGAPGFFTLWGLMFVCVGLYFVLGRFIVDAFLRTRMRYAVTSQRILILREWAFSSFTALYLERLPELRLNEGRGGSGTIKFGSELPIWGRGLGVWSPSASTTPQFFAIQDVRRVFETIQTAIRAERSR